MTDIQHRDIDEAECHPPKAHASTHEDGGSDEIAKLTQLTKELWVKQATPYVRLTGTEASAEDIRLVETGGFTKLQKNTGSEGSPKWSDLLVLDETGELSGITGLALSGDLQVGGSTVIDSSGNLRLASAGPHAIGGAAAGQMALRFSPTFTSDGSSTTAFGLFFDASITGSPGDTARQVGAEFRPSMTTQGATETISEVGSVRIEEPRITVGSGDTITNAYSLKIVSAPTEGANNYGLWVGGGLTRFDGPVSLAGSSADPDQPQGLSVKPGGGIRLHAGGSSRLEINTSGAVFINETVNANMSVGLTVAQGGNNDEIFAGKSTAIAHGRTGLAETDTYFSFRKAQGSLGGLEIRSIMEDQDPEAPVTVIRSSGGGANAFRSTGAKGLIHFFAEEHDGANSAADVAADGNVFGISARVGGADRTILLLDEDGDLHYDGTTNADAWDEHDDVALLTAVRGATMRECLSETFRRAAEDPRLRRVLEETGVVTFNDDGHHFVSHKGLTGLMIDAIRQLGDRNRQLESRLARLEA